MEKHYLQFFNDSLIDLFLGFFWILLKKVLVVLVDSVSSVVLVITFHVIR